MQHTCSTYKHRARSDARWALRRRNACNRISCVHGSACAASRHQSLPPEQGEPHFYPDPAQQHEDMVVSLVGLQACCCSGHTLSPTLFQLDVDRLLRGSRHV